MRKIISTLILVLAISCIAKAQSNRLKVDGGIQTDTISVKKINIANGSGNTVLLGDGNSATLGTGLSIANGVISSSSGVTNVTSTVDTTSLSNRINKKLDAADTTKLKAYTDSKVAGIVIPSVTKSSLGLDKVDNTSDASKPISTATQEALDAKLDYSTYSSFQSSMLYVLNQKAFSYELTNGLASKADTSALALKATKAALTAGLAAKADTSALALKATKAALSAGLATKLNAADTTKLKTYVDTKVAAIEVPSVTKSSLGLDNVNNTSDADKPISTSTQAALDAKADTTALALKASKAALTAGLALKADASALDAKLNAADTTKLKAYADKLQLELVNKIEFEVNNAYSYTNSVIYNDVLPTVNSNLTAGLAAKADTSALALKATKAALTAGLAAKADTAALALKATKAALTAGLAAKADTSALSLKATKTALTTGLAAKADTSALSLKADKTALTLKADASALALKADASALASKADTTALNAKADTAALALKANKIQNVLVISDDNNTINLTANHDMVFVKGTNDTLYLPNAANNAGKKIEMIIRGLGNNYIKVSGNNGIYLPGNIYPFNNNLFVDTTDPGIRFVDLGQYSELGGNITSAGYLRVTTGLAYQGYRTFVHLVFNCDGTAWYLSILSYQGI